MTWTDRMWMALVKPRDEYIKTKQTHDPCYERLVSGDLVPDETSDARMSARAVLDNAMSEAEWMQSIIDLAQSQGYLVAHIPDRLYQLAAKQRRFDAMTGAKALPDLIIVGLNYAHGDVPQPTVYFLETKTMRGAVAPEQQEWIDRVDQAVLVQGEIVRPDDWERIKHMMTGVDDDH